MISHLYGKILYKDQNSFIIDVNNIGYRVFVVQRILEKAKPDQEIKLYTYLYVREDALNLYGFEEEEELELFIQLLSVSGIGPKTALGIFSIANAGEIKKAIKDGDAEILTKVSGIGKKGAERIIIELRNKIKNLKDEVPGQGLQNKDSETIEALISLGYSRQQAVEALRQVPTIAKSTEERIRQTLKIIGK